MEHKMKKLIGVFLIISLLLCSCGGADEPAGSRNADTSAAEEVETAEAETAEAAAETENAEEMNYNMQMMIGDTPVEVAWEDNEAVKALAELNAGDWHEYQLSMYGGFEQVGPLGSDLPASDSQTSTSAGDIVLYQGNQIVVFYGENSWAYTRLGHITDKSAGELAELPGNGDVVISLRAE
jgi:hypothetical protein